MEYTGASGVDDRYNHPDKVYVEATVKYDLYGNITPKSFRWDDGRVYEIDEVIQKDKAASLKAGGTGLRYTIRVRGRTTYMWLEVDRWFMERK